MLKHFVLLFILFNCLIFPQSDNPVYETIPGFINNEMEFRQNSSSQIHQVPLPHLYEIVSDAPINIYGVVRNSFTPENLPAIGYLSALTATLVMTDAQTHSAIKTFFRNNKSLNNYGKYAVYLGDGKIDIGIGSLFALYGVTFSDNLAVRTGIQCTEAIVSNGILVQLLKRISGRESPLSASSKTGTWRLFPNFIKYQKNQPKYYSFPSGHLSTAMATLTVIAENYTDSHFIRPIGYSLEGLLGLSLVSRDVHWFSDFPLAWALGYEFGMFITSRNISVKGNKENSNSLNVSFMPLYLSRGAGIDMLVSF